MLQNKTSRLAICISTSLMVLVFGLRLPVSIARANPDPGKAATAATYRAKCALCHGPDGAGSETGKAMNIPDLRSPAVRNRPDTDLAQVISDGKGGMPAFKSSLSQDQIHALVTYIHSLGGKKEK